jgi:hypothetical protein
LTTSEVGQRLLEKKAIYSEHQQQRLPTFRNSGNSIFPARSHVVDAGRIRSRLWHINWPRVLSKSNTISIESCSTNLKQRAYAGALPATSTWKQPPPTKIGGQCSQAEKRIPEQILSQMIRFILKVNREVNNLG